MGKKFFTAIIVAVVAMFAGYNIYASQKSVVTSALALANVEALAWNEVGNNNCRWCDELADCFTWADGTGCYCGMYN